MKRYAGFEKIVVCWLVWNSAGPDAHLVLINVILNLLMGRERSISASSVSGFLEFFLKTES